MNSFFQSSVTKLLLCLGIVIFLSACDTDDNLDLALSTDTDISLTYVDTARVNVSTVYLDSVFTSGTGALLVGQVNDNLLGTTNANATFQIGLNTATSWSLSEDAVLDSINLVLPLSGYTYGDTTQTITLQVARVSENLTPRTLSPYIGTEEPFSYFYGTEGFYNHSKTAASAALGTINIKPRPSVDDSILVPLPKSLGQEWIDLKKADNSRLTTAADFLEYFKGLQLSAVSGGQIIGFSAEGVKVRVYYRAPSDETTQNYTYDFPLTTGTTQYNQLENNAGGTLLQQLTPGSNPIASTSNNQMGVIQAGTGLVVKLDFPYLDGLKTLFEPNLINKVYLEVTPVTGTNLYPFTPPAALTLFQIDPANVPSAPLYQNYSTTAEQTAAYTASDENSTDAKYSFDVTEYLIGQFSRTQPGEVALLLSVPRSTMMASVNRLIIGGPEHVQNRVKLKIYYTKL